MADLCLDEFTDHGHCGVLDAARQRRQRRDPAALRRRWPRPRPAPARTCVGTSGMMDGQVAAVRAALDAGRVHRHRDPRLRGQVRVGLLRAVPRGGRFLARRRPQDLPARRWTGGGRGAGRGRPRRRRGRRRGDGQAGAALSRRAARGRRRVAGSGRGLPSQRRVRDGRGGGRERLARSRSGHRRNTSLRSSGRGPR